MEAPQIEARIAVPTHRIAVGLLKIAYLGAYHFLGDTFLRDPGNLEWQKGICSTEYRPEDQPRIQTINVCGTPYLPVLFPKLAPHEHAVTVCNLRQAGPVIAVRLFDSDFLTQVYLASENNDFGLSVLEGRIVICDSTAKQIRQESFEDHFVKYSETLGGDPAPEGAR